MDGLWTKTSSLHGEGSKHTQPHLLFVVRESLLQDRERLCRLSLSLLHKPQPEEDAAPFAERAALDEGVCECEVASSLVVVAGAVVSVREVLVEEG